MDVQHYSVEGQFILECAVVSESSAEQGAVTWTLQREANGPLIVSATVANKWNRHLVDDQVFLRQINFNGIVRQNQP